METNYFGTLSMYRAFAPVLAANGGGAIVNMLSVTSFYNNPLDASYGASKAAAWSLTNGVRLGYCEALVPEMGGEPGHVPLPSEVRAAGPAGSNET
jgi:NAD(P)-dependent dehydrogenase (short-subunit alcohol dehydrogenase family)